MPPSLSPEKPRIVIKVLLAQGFEFHHQRGSHKYYVKEGQARPVCVPYHPGDIKLGTLRAILKQAGISVEEFNRLKKC